MFTNSDQFLQWMTNIKRYHIIPDNYLPNLLNSFRISLSVSLIWSLMILLCSKQYFLYFFGNIWQNLPAEAQLGRGPGYGWGWGFPSAPPITSKLIIRKIAMKETKRPFMMLVTWQLDIKCRPIYPLKLLRNSDIGVMRVRICVARDVKIIIKCQYFLCFMVWEIIYTEIFALCKKNEKD